MRKSETNQTKVPVDLPTNMTQLLRRAEERNQQTLITIHDEEQESKASPFGNDDDQPQNPNQNHRKRVASLDIFRGFTVAVIFSYLFTLFVLLFGSYSAFKLLISLDSKFKSLC